MKSKTPRILILNYEYPPLGGGAANALYHVLGEFAALGGIGADLVTTSATGRFEQESLGDDIVIHKLAVRKANPHYWKHREIFDYTRLASTYMKRLSAARDYALCHAWFALPCGLMANRRRGRLPYIVSLRGSDVPGFNARLDWMNTGLRPLFRKVLRDSSAVQANSEGLKDLALKSCPGADIDIIHNGVDCRKFSPGDENVDRGIDRASRPPSGTYRLLSVCRLIGRKGLDDLISVLPTASAALGPIELTLVGEGNLKIRLRRLAESLGVSDMIKWVGYVDHDDLPSLYRAADLFVLPSHFEGMSNSLLEAMASGLPVVVSKTGGTTELVDGNGNVFCPGDRTALAEAIIGLLSDEQARSASAERSRQLALQFSWTNVARRYLETYERVIGAPKPVVGMTGEKRT